METVIAKPKSRDGAALALVFAMISLLPGILGGIVVLHSAAEVVLDGRLNWPFAYIFIQTLVEYAALLAWIRPTRSIFKVSFLTLSSITVILAVLMVEFLQYEISLHQDLQCGQLLLGAMAWQATSLGTIIGVAILMFFHLRRPTP